jgi:hypothetical protein
LGITHVIFVDPLQYFLLGRFEYIGAKSVYSLFQTAKAIFVIISLFFLTMGTFATLTSKAGELLNKEAPLKGYSLM